MSQYEQRAGPRRRKGTQRLQRRRDRPIFPSGSLAGALERWRKANCRLAHAYFLHIFTFNLQPIITPEVDASVSATDFIQPAASTRSVPTLSNKINAFPPEKKL